MSSSNPFTDIERFFERMSDQFDDASRRWGSGDGWSSAFESMAVDLLERDDEFVVTADLPGFERDDIDIRVTDHTLRIEAERDEETETEDETYLRRERRHATASRSIRLPEEVETDGVSARMEHGVLTVTLPRAEVTEAKRIEIGDD